MEQTVSLERMEQAVSLFGNFDENIRLLEKEYGVHMVLRGADIKIEGEEENVALALRAVSGLLTLINRGEILSEQNVRYVVSLVAEGDEESLTQLADNEVICITSKGRPVKPKTLGQKKYVDAIGKNTVTLCVGPAGTGKTYLAVALAVMAFRARSVNRIILTRPAVEAGEKLGFLPGDLQQKVELAYMRGRTLDDSFIILDEAQNTTPEQMKMFLTRLGNNSKIVVTGDITQIDLPDGKKSGLMEAVQVLKLVEDVAVIRFTEKDVVRHKLVQDIIKAYERFEENRRRR